MESNLFWAPKIEPSFSSVHILTYFSANSIQIGLFIDKCFYQIKYYLGTEIKKFYVSLDFSKMTFELFVAEHKLRPVHPSHLPGMKTEENSLRLDLDALLYLTHTR